MKLKDALKYMTQNHIKIKNGGYSDLISIDLINKNIRSNQIYLMKDGKVVPQVIKYGSEKIEIEDGLSAPSNNFFEELDELYRNFKYSVPSKNSKYIKYNFIALPSDKLTIKNLSEEMSRLEARIDLEIFILENSLQNNIKFKDEKHWFYQSDRFPELILYKKYL